MQPSELVSYLQQHIAEQKRYDATLSGGQAAPESSPIQPVVEKPTPAADTLVVLPNDVKKARKSNKSFYGNKGSLFLPLCDSQFIHLFVGFEHATALKTAMPGIRTVVVDVTTAVFDEMAKNNNWLTSDEALRTIAAGMPTQHAGYAQQIREAVLRQRAEGHRYVLLYGIRQERLALLTLG